MTTWRRVALSIAPLLLLACDESAARSPGDGGASDHPAAARETAPPADVRREAQPQGKEAGTPVVDGTKPKLDSANPFPTQNGKITYYNADGSGNCGFDPSPSDLMVAAMNDVEYAGSQVCGACVSVTGPKGTIVVRIVDRCPECLKGHLDLSKEAFAKLADLALGVVPVTWKFVACNVSGPIRYKFKEGSNPWWSAIQVRNLRYAVTKFEAKKSGSWVAIPRESYNYFVYASGLGIGPYDLRVTDVLGHVLTDTGIAFKEGQEVPGAAQFPP
jgi:expansin (peptidoglycan-binding protein)